MPPTTKIDNGLTTYSSVVSVKVMSETSEFKFKFTLLPNPSNGQELIIRLKGRFSNGRISVYDWVGKKMYEGFSLSADDYFYFRLDCRLESGMYLVKLQVDSQVLTQRLLVAQ